MITREELEKMIENGGTVWTRYYGLKGLNFSELPKDRYYLDNDCLHMYGCCHGEAYDDEIDFGWFYKTEEEAKWRDKFATREERFEPPHWSEIDLPDSSLLYKSLYEFALPNPFYCGKIYATELCIYVLYDTNIKDFGKPTKVNYEKAVDFARKLFLGEVGK